MPEMPPHARIARNPCQIHCFPSPHLPLRSKQGVRLTLRNGAALRGKHDDDTGSEPAASRATAARGSERGRRRAGAATPAHAATATACDVVVTTPDGTGTGTALFSYMKSSQTLVFGTAPVLMVGGAAGTVSAASSAAVLNGLTTFSSLTPDTCTVSGTAVSAVAAGTCRVAANNPGNGDYLAAAPVTQDIAVAPAPVRSVTGTPPGASASTASFRRPAKSR